ncbi:MAG: copper amine oxidase N-terminal domain-containing protein [Eubacteriales bacterium]
MKKNPVIIIAIAVLLLLIMTSAAMAGDKVGLKLNGDPVPFAGLIFENGTVFVPAYNYVKLAGVDYEWLSDEELKLVENNDTLIVTAGKKEAVFNSKPVLLPAAPIDTVDDLLLPLRFVCSAFGFEVKWIEAEQLVTLKRNETREGMTPADLLIKSNQMESNINTYSLTGDMYMGMDMSFEGESADYFPEMATETEGRVKIKPFQYYAKTSIATADDSDNEDAIITEAYMTEDKIYMKAPGEEWTVIEIPFMKEFIQQQQQDIQFNPIKAASQMKEIGLLPNFGNDLTIDGQEYFVVNTALDMNKLLQDYQEILDPLLEDLASAEDEVDPEELSSFLKMMMNKMDIDYYLTAYINRKTLISDFVDFDAHINMSITSADIAELGIDTESDQAEQTPGEEVPHEMTIDMYMEGEMYLFDFGKLFKAPDVSHAVPADQKTE